MFLYLTLTRISNCITIEDIHSVADDVTLSWYLEAYVLWLFRWVLFCNTHNNMVDNVLVPDHPNDR
jgi:hypothetical protein